MRTSSSLRRATHLHPRPLLSRATLGGLAGRVDVPQYDARELTSGVVHLGVGAFHRSHQAVYFHRLAQAGVRDWGVTGVGVRSSRLREELLAQDGLYTVTELSAAAPAVEVVGVLRDYLSAAAQPAAVRRALDDPRTRVVTVTVTAPTYAEPPSAHSVFGLVAAALDRRRRARTAPFTLLSCDNLPANGDSLRRCVVEAAALVGPPALAAWIEARVAFPDSMVDRITPPPGAAHRRELRAALGVDDRAAVVAEPFAQWVLEDTGAPLPPLADVGVQLVEDVSAHVELKTRVLNAGHVALGFLGGTLPTTDAAMADPAVGGAVHRLLVDEVLPLLRPVPGVSLTHYLRQIEDRFRNPAVADPLARLRRRASVRFGNYLWPSVEAAVRAGAPYDGLLDVVVAWLRHLQREAASVDAGTRTAREVREELQDPATDRLLQAVREGRRDLRPFLAAADAPAWLAQHPGFLSRLHAVADGEGNHAVA